MTLNDPKGFTGSESALRSQMDEDWIIIQNRIDKLSEKEAVRDIKIGWIRAAVAVLFILLASGFFLLSMNEHVSVPIGQTAGKQFYLPDGTSVFMLPGSHLRYPKNITKGNRKVALRGEAIFDVASDQLHPFMVNMREAKIEVTGTIFLVSAPKNQDEIEVIVESGKVLFYNSKKFNEDAVSVGLTAGERGIYSVSGKSMDKINELTLRSIP